jgi:hypothetical protein
MKNILDEMKDLGIKSNERTELIHTHSLIKNQFVHGYMDITQKIEKLMLITDLSRRMKCQDHPMVDLMDSRQMSVLETSDFNVFLGFYIQIHSMNGEDLSKHGIDRDHCYETLMEVWSRAPRTKIKVELAAAVRKTARSKKNR